MGMGSRINVLCKEKKMSLRQLAIKSEIPYSTLYSAVKRDSNGMDVMTLKAIAEALDVSWYELVSEVPEEQAKAIKAYMSEKIAMCGDQEYTKRAFLAREITTDYYNQLNTDGKLAAYKIIYERIDNDALYDSIQDFKALVDTPQYQKKAEE